MEIWEDLLSEHDRRCLANYPSLGRIGRRPGLGKKPALLVIDMQVGVVGEDCRYHPAEPCHEISFIFIYAGMLSASHLIGL